MHNFIADNNGQFHCCRLQRFEKTNEMLTNCNALSVNRLKSAGTEFKKHTQLLLEMKKDLDSIFKRIRVMTTKLASQYPEAFSGKLFSYFCCKYFTLSGTTNVSTYVDM